MNRVLLALALSAMLYSAKGKSAALNNNLSRWYATTWHYFDTGQGVYSLFTATDSGRANAYCWNNLTCF